MWSSLRIDSLVAFYVTILQMNQQYSFLRNKFEKLFQLSNLKRNKGIVVCIVEKIFLVHVKITEKYNSSGL